MLDVCHFHTASDFPGTLEEGEFAEKDLITRAAQITDDNSRGHLVTVSTFELFFQPHLHVVFFDALTLLQPAGKALRCQSHDATKNTALRQYFLVVSNATKTRRYLT